MAYRFVSILLIVETPSVSRNKDTSIPSSKTGYKDTTYKRILYIVATPMNNSVNLYV